MKLPTFFFRSKILKKLRVIYLFWRSGQRVKAFQELRKGCVKFDQRCGRGERLFSFITRPLEACLIKGGIIVLFVEKIVDKLNHAFGWGWVIPVWCWIVALPLWYIIQKVIEYRGGRFDQKTLKLWQEEVKWASENINPWEQEKMKHLRGLSKDVREIKKEMKKKT